MKELSHKTIKLLIKAGKSEEDEPAIIDLLHPIKKEVYINCGYARQWKKASQQFDITELIALVRGLVLAERLFEWMGGSAAAAIYVFQEVENRDFELSQKLADWVLHNTNNVYLPFGGDNYDAKSLAEYQLRSSRHRAKINEGLRIQKESEKKAEEDRRIRERQRKKSAEHRDTKIRKQFIEELSKKTLAEQLIQLSQDQEYSVQFYPTKIAHQARLGFLMNLDEGLKIALLEKLKGKHKGPWGKLKGKLFYLYRVENGWWTSPWNRKPWFY